jgi:trans-aconitate 2-methyltransferase
MSWDPSQYLKFADQRRRPAIDLLSRIALDAPKRVYDLGCGAGNVTRLLAARWPQAHMVGVDSSAAMLEKAGTDKSPAGAPAIEWVQADLATWKPDTPPDLIYSNAALHWLDDHRGLFPRLVAALAPGGVLAVQMPRNHQAPSHTGMADAARSGRWRATLEPLLREGPVQQPSVYFDILAGAGVRADIWETEYLQLLEGEDAVVEWTKGTALKPLLDALDEPARGQFLADYKARMRAAYPRRADGVTLFPFRRLFIVATRA